jgi:hypothetical protein
MLDFCVDIRGVFAASLPLIATIQQTSPLKPLGVRVREEDVLRLPSECQIGYGWQGAVFKASVVDETGERLAVAIKISLVSPMSWRG